MGTGMEAMAGLFRQRAWLRTIQRNEEDNYGKEIDQEAEAKRVNAKSIMGMMTLCLTAGEAITVVAEGDDEEQAVSEIEKYLKNQE